MCRIFKILISLQGSIQPRVSYENRYHTEYYLLGVRAAMIHTQEANDLPKKTNCSA
jgi:hypothetical protein